MTYIKDGKIEQSAHRGNTRKTMKRPSTKGMAPDWQIKGKNLITGFKVRKVFVVGNYYGEWGELHKD
jgi:hypothetical protein